MLNFLVYPDCGSWLLYERRGIPQRPTHLLWALQERQEVGALLVVEPPYPIVKAKLDQHRYRLRTGGVRWRHLGACIRQVDEKIYVLELPSIPPSRGRMTQGLTQRLGDWLIQRGITALGLQPFVLWFSVPYNSRLVGRFGESLAVFDDAGANWLTWCQPHEQAEIEAGYHSIRQQADVILTATTTMQHDLGQGREDVYLLPNAVDMKPFEVETLPCPPALQHLPRPWLGYVGALGQRIDLRLIRALSAAFPHGSIPLVGPVPEGEQDGLKRLAQQCANVHLLGACRYEEVPLYMSQFDVGLIPNVHSELTLSQSPMKLYEYFAAGKPVVSTSVFTEPIADELIYFADTPEAFVRAAQRALEEKDAHIAEARKRQARRESWQSRADTFLRIVHAVLDRNEPVQVDSPQRLAS